VKKTIRVTDELLQELLSRKILAQTNVDDILVSCLAARVVSPEISRAFWKFPEIYSFFSRKFLERFTGNFLPLQTFHVTVHLLTTTLFKGFYSTGFSTDLNFQDVMTSELENLDGGVQNLKVMQ